MGDRVLAPGVASSPPSSSTRATELDFLPSWVVAPTGEEGEDEEQTGDAEEEEGEERFVVKRCDGSVIPNADPLQCFWITRDFFDEAVKYLEMRSD